MAARLTRGAGEFGTFQTRSCTLVTLAELIASFYAHRRCKAKPRALVEMSEGGYCIDLFCLSIGPFCGSLEISTYGVLLGIKSMPSTLQKHALSNINNTFHLHWVHMYMSKDYTER